DPDTGLPIVVKDGRFGPYVTDGTTNASLRRSDGVEELTLERATELLAERRAAGPAKKAARRGTKATAKKPAAKKTTARKTTAKKATARKTTAKKAGAQRSGATRSGAKKATRATTEAAVSPDGSDLGERSDD
ncbi:MAG TPA: topoisomerase C-terminal repeat-containing protein, partial [Acidimicrobiales bacterium]|nr:topoisomerase C-terminal repeat-containing protein [Acidimicrobiales bacterium]